MNNFENIKKFYELFNIDIESTHFFRKNRTMKDGSIPAISSSGKDFSIKSVYENNYGKDDNKRSFTNLFFTPNGFNEIYSNGKLIEKRTKDNLNGINAFYFDFDLDDNSLKDELLKRIKALPVEPSAIVESRNGYHIYFALEKNQDSFLGASSEVKLTEWKRLETIMFNYMHFNISEFVDKRCLDVTRILRMPYTFHKKKANKDYFEVKLIHLGKQYTLEELQPLLVETRSSTSSKEVKAIKPQKRKANTSSYNTEFKERLEALQNLDSSFFGDEFKFPKTNIMTKKQFTDYISNISFFELLHMNEQMSFCSFLREDNHPSASYVVADNGAVLYHDFGTGETFNTISLTERLSSSSVADVIKFFQRLTNIEISELLDINEHLKRLKAQFRNKYRHDELLKKCKPVYYAILDALKREYQLKKVDYGKFEVMATLSYLRKETGLSVPTILKYENYLVKKGYLRGAVYCYKTEKKQPTLFVVKTTYNVADVVNNAVVMSAVENFENFSKNLEKNCLEQVA